MYSVGAGVSHSQTSAVMKSVSVSVGQTPAVMKSLACSEGMDDPTSAVTKSDSEGMVGNDAREADGLFAVTDTKSDECVLEGCLCGAASTSLG